MASFVNHIVGSPYFHAVELYVAWFPVLFAFLAINSSRQFRLDRRGIVTQRLEPDSDDVELAHDRWPRLTIIIPVHDGVATIGRTIHDAQHIAWPEIELIVVDDGSSDGTAELLEVLAKSRTDLRVLHHSMNEGKAKALNHAIDVATGEIFLICDDDSIIPPSTAVLLAAQLAHHDELAAVTANPRMLRTQSMIEKLQAIEFSSTVSTQRRGHAAWGRISTISGVCTMFRTDAVRAIGGFDATQPTEDIEITWRLQCAGWRVAYEPLAVIGTYPESTMRSWFRQRRRWAAGLTRALVANLRSAMRPRNYTVWPLLLEGLGSILWCHLLMLTFVLAATSLALGNPPHGNFVVIGAWGTFTLCIAILQSQWGMHLDKDDDASIGRLRWYVPLFPLFYWILLAVTVVISTIPALFVRRRDVQW